MNDKNDINNYFGLKDVVNEKERLLRQKISVVWFINDIENNISIDQKVDESAVKKLCLEYGLSGNKSILDCIAFCNEAIKINRNASYQHFMKAKCLIKTEEYESSLIELNEAIKIDSDIADFYLYRGYVNNFLNRVDDGLKDIKKTVELDSSCLNQYVIHNLQQKKLSKKISNYFQEIKLSKELNMSVEEFNKFKNKIYLEARRKYGAYELLFKKHHHFFEDDFFFIDSPLPIAGQDAIISCPSGWFLLIERMLNELEDYLDKKDLEFTGKFKIYQIKEKWLELRVQLSDNVYDLNKSFDDYLKKINSIISRYEKKSSLLCFQCGREKKLKEYEVSGRFVLLCNYCSESFKGLEV